jgi:hypothetical protein
LPTDNVKQPNNNNFQVLAMVTEKSPSLEKTEEKNSEQKEEQPSDQKQKKSSVIPIA